MSHVKINFHLNFVCRLFAGKDSPSSKLLYAKDIPIYKDWVTRYYQVSVFTQISTRPNDQSETSCAAFSMDTMDTFQDTEYGYGHGKRQRHAQH
jgi:hypothetical protein